MGFYTILLYLFGGLLKNTLILCASVGLPAHSRVYVVVCCGVTVCEPEIDFLPDHPPDAVHDDALFSAFQVRVALWPRSITVGDAVNVSSER